jgi:hypothetical protein
VPFIAREGGGAGDVGAQGEQARVGLDAGGGTPPTPLATGTTTSR